jgi:O-methyltransferase involved in polyketide biosynthesis
MLPLWARARETEKDSPVVLDPYAKDIVETVDYDFSQIEKGPAAQHQGVWALRAYNFDKITEAFLEKNDGAVVINIGAGLDTSFQRVDEGSVQWINIDLPDVAALRQKLIPDSDRETTIAKSVLDFTWIDDISRRTEARPILFTAAGVLCYLEAQEVETLFSQLSETYPSAHFIFDSMSWLVAWGTNKEIMKNSGFDPSTLIRWYSKRASALQNWVETIRILEEYPMLSKVPERNSFSKKEMLQIKIVGLFRFYNMIHVQL